MIPKIIHQIWINFKNPEEPGVIPDKYVPWMASWKEHHPDWEYRLWGAPEIKTLINDHYPEWLSVYESCQYPVQRTDIARVLIVHHHGGMYADSDTECLKPFDRYLDHDLVAIQSSTVFLSNHFFMSRPGNPVLSDYLDRIRQNISAPIFPVWLYIFYSTGPLAMHMSCIGKDYTMIKMSEFPDFLMMKLFSGDFLAIHHSQGSWMHPKMIEVFHVIIGKMINKIAV